MPILRKYDDKFKQYTRMKVETFDYILSKIEDDLTKDWCNLHNRPILPEEQLIVTSRQDFALSYLCDIVYIILKY